MSFPEISSLRARSAANFPALIFLRIIPLCAMLLLAVAGCVTQTINVKGVIGIPDDSKVYTAHNIFYKNPSEVPSINYLDGKILPVGTEVNIEQAKYRAEDREDIVEFVVASTRMRFTIVHHKRWRDKDDSLHRLMKEMFTDKNFDEQTKGIPADMLSAIRSGKAIKGMTREQTIMALGPPSSHRTKDRAHSTWMYWYGPEKTLRIIFGKDKIKHIME